MTQHFTRNTVSAEFWCGKCKKRTQHRIDKGRKGPCLDCIGRLEKESAGRKIAAAERPQKELFA